MLVVNPRKQKLCIQVKDTVGFTDITIGTGEVWFCFSTLTILLHTLPIYLLSGSTHRDWDDFS